MTNRDDLIHCLTHDIFFRKGRSCPICRVMVSIKLIRAQLKREIPGSKTNKILNIVEELITDEVER